MPKDDNASGSASASASASAPGPKKAQYKSKRSPPGSRNGRGGKCRVARRSRHRLCGLRAEPHAQGDAARCHPGHRSLPSRLAAPPHSLRSPLPEFMAAAKPQLARVGAHDVKLQPKRFGTGTVGWMSTSKKEIRLRNGRTVKCQVCVGSAKLALPVVVERGTSLCTLTRNTKIVQRLAPLAYFRCKCKRSSSEASSGQLKLMGSERGRGRGRGTRD